MQVEQHEFDDRQAQRRPQDPPQEGPELTIRGGPRTTPKSPPHAVAGILRQAEVQSAIRLQFGRSGTPKLRQTSELLQSRPSDGVFAGGSPSQEGLLVFGPHEEAEGVERTTGGASYQPPYSGRRTQ